MEPEPTPPLNNERIAASFPARQSWYLPMCGSPIGRPPPVAVLGPVINQHVAWFGVEAFVPRPATANLDVAAQVMHHPGALVSTSLRYKGGDANTLRPHSRMLLKVMKGGWGGHYPLGHLRRGGGPISALRATRDPTKGDPGGEAADAY
jgi:hypothetical protein